MRVGFGRHVELLRVRVAQLVVLIERTDTPLVVRDAHPLELVLQLEVVPAGRLRQLLRRGRVLEAVQIFDVHRLVQLGERGVHVVTFALLRYDERDGEERLAAYQQRRAGGAQGQLFHVRDVHVKDLVPGWKGKLQNCYKQHTENTRPVVPRVRVGFAVNGDLLEGPFKFV